jgi:hypothetical protein
MAKNKMCVDFQYKLSGMTNTRQEFMVWQIKSHFSIECRFSLFSLIITMLLAMVVGDNGSTATKIAGESLAISIAMAMQQYDAGRIARWSSSRASL